MKETIQKILDPKRVLVLGDVMLDKYTVGLSERMSPEAPVPVLDVGKRYSRLGGAANVAANLASMGMQTHLISVLGDDEAAMELEKLANGIQCNFLKTKNRLTTIKERIVSNNQQVIRLDTESKKDISEEVFSKIKIEISKTIEKYDIQIAFLQDYNKGFFTSWNIQEIIKILRTKGIFIAVDPKFENFNLYNGVQLFKPNRKEIETAFEIKIELGLAHLKEPIEKICKQLGCENLMITLSENGNLIINSHEIIHTPTDFTKIKDPSGAGDSVLAFSGLAFFEGISLNSIGKLANTIGAIACNKFGVSVISSDEIKHII